MGGRFASSSETPLEANGVPPTYDSLHKCRKAKTPFPANTDGPLGDRTLVAPSQRYLPLLKMCTH